ncbi:MAG TPA: hypothetical protein VFL14_09845 [Xanthomonadales bacterium]|nr:hypothetical protein [Xanthomonadales bacterium]
MRAPKYVSTLWFEPTGAARHTPCRRESSDGRVRLRNLALGTVQADLSEKLYRTLLANGFIRPLDEVPTLPSNRRPKLAPSRD